MSKLLERFLTFVKIYSQSDENSTTFPSTSVQLAFADFLAEELKKIGLSAVSVDENGYVMASLPGNSEKTTPVIGFISHMDTSSDMTGEDVKPQIVKNYDGKDIVLNQEKNIILSPNDFPELCDYIGQTIITTDGNTLLGADNKSGIAEIITAMEYLIQHPEIKHGELKIAFTPDEEIGRGVDFFDVGKFGAQYAYTIDGGRIGELEYENFNAAKAIISIQGSSIHPGSAKNRLVNAQLLAMEFNNYLPQSQRPELTENYEGFFHLTDMEGKVEHATLKYIIRDHDKLLFEKKKDFMLKTADFMNLKYGDSTVKVDLSDQYYNMKEKVEPVFHIVKIAEQAMIDSGIQPNIIPIRGGTDGSRLSYMGLPCPNIFTGGHNFHGKYEFIPLESMEKAVQVIVRIAELFAQSTK